jgi:hypothetical protein
MVGREKRQKRVKGKNIDNRVKRQKEAEKMGKGEK